MRYLLAIAIIFLFSSFNAGSAQGYVTGKITDSKSHEPLYGVYVISGKHVTTSNQDGQYIVATDTGKIIINFRLIGYKTVTKNLDIHENDSISLDTSMDMDLREIGQIVVSANKTEQKIAELTVSMDVLRSADIANNHITDAQELINKTPGIEIMDGQASVRGGSGFSYGVGSRVLALIDGLPVVSPDAGNVKWQFLPLENISQVEIIKGASSVLYGSSALNGVINFRTADASLTPVTKFYAEAGVYGKPRNRHWIWSSTPLLFSDFSFSHLEKYGNTDIGVAASFLTDEGYRKFNDEKLGRLNIRIKQHSSGIRGLTYGINLNTGYTSKRDFILWDNATTGALIQDTSTVTRLHGTFIAIDPFISFDNNKKFKHDLRIRFQSSMNKFPVRTDKNSDALSLYAEYQQIFTINEFIKLTSGLSESYNKILSNFYGDHTESNLAGYAQVETNPLSGLKLIGGIRLEEYFLDGSADKIVPVFRTGINWQAASFTFIRGSFGQGYRYPSIAEKFASTTLGSIKIFPNPYINPESGWNSEIGIKQGILIGEIKGQADVSFFLSQNKDMIEFLFGSYPDMKTGIYDFGFQAENIEQSRIYGCELEFTLARSFSQISTTLSGGYTLLHPVEYNQATGKNTNIWLKYRRKHSLKLSLDVTYKKLNAGLTAYYKSKILSIDDVFLNQLTREQILPGFYEYWQNDNKPYAVADLNIGYQLSRIFNLSLVIKNFTNTEYMGRPGDIQPQRNYSLRLSGTF